MVCKYFLLFCELPFHSVVSLRCRSFLILLIYLVFAACVFGVKSVSRPMSQSFPLKFSFKSFTVLDPIFKSLFHFELIFVYGVG